MVKNMIEAYEKSRLSAELTKKLANTQYLVKDTIPINKYTFHALKNTHEFFMHEAVNFTTTNVTDILFDFELINQLITYLLENNILKPYVMFIGIHDNGTDSTSQILEQYINAISNSVDAKQYNRLYAVEIHNKRYEAWSYDGDIISTVYQLK